jgi:hypothetical protein
VIRQKIEYVGFELLGSGPLAPVEEAVVLAFVGPVSDGVTFLEQSFSAE